MTDAEEDLADGPVLSLNQTDLVHVSSTHGVSFDGVDIVYGKGWGAVFENCEGCGISNAFVGNTGINGVNVTGGFDFKLVNVEVTGTGQGGVILEGGNRTDLVS